jgi:hypothetical protein
MTFLYFGKRFRKYLMWRYPKIYIIKTLSQAEIYIREIQGLILNRKKSFLKIVEIQSPFSRNIDKVISKRLKYF